MSDQTVLYQDFDPNDSANIGAVLEIESLTSAIAFPVDNGEFTSGQHVSEVLVRAYLLEGKAFTATFTLGNTEFQFTSENAIRRIMPKLAQWKFVRKNGKSA